MFFPIITNETKTLPIYMTGIGCQENQEDILRPSGYVYHQISYCVCGEGIFKAGGREYRVKKGMVFFFSPNVPHEYYALKEPWTVRWLTFEGSCAAKIIENLGFREHDIFNFIENDMVEKAMNELRAVAVSNYHNRELECSAMIYNLIVKMGRYIGDCHKNDNDRISQRLSTVIAYMQKNLTRQLTLEEMAAVIGVSSSYLCRLFKQAYTTTPFQYLIKMRIQKAKQLLCQRPELNIKEIGHICCFDDTSYFCSAFREEEGVTPKNFRKIHGL